MVLILTCNSFVFLILKRILKTLEVRTVFMFLGTACLPKSSTTQNQRKVGQNFKSATEIAAYFHFFIRYLFVAAAQKIVSKQQNTFCLLTIWKNLHRQPIYMEKRLIVRKAFLTDHFILKVLQAYNFSFFS